MRVVICGDSHIGAVFGLGGPNGSGGNTRIDDYVSSFNHIIDYAIEIKADAFIQTGDIFELRSPSSEHMSIVNSALKRLSRNNITSIVIMGNHDYRRAGDDFTSAISSLSAKDYPSVRLVLRPQVINIASGEEDLNILLMPYRDRRMYGGGSTEEDSILYNKHVEDLISGVETDSPMIAVGHNFFYEGSYNDFGGAEILSGIKSFEGCKLVVMGHQHNFRIVKNKNPTAIYSGSMEKINFGDTLVDKYFIDYNSKEDRVLIKDVPSRGLYDTKISLEDYDLQDIGDGIKEAVDKLAIKDKIVRITISVKEYVASMIDKKSIEDVLYSNGAFYVSKVIVDPISQRIVRDTSVLSCKDDLSMFSAFISSQVISEEERVAIIAAAKNIIESKAGE